MKKNNKTVVILQKLTRKWRSGVFEQAKIRLILLLLVTFFAASLIFIGMFSFYEYLIVILTLLSLLMIMQAFFTLWWMLYAWEHPERIERNKSPDVYIKPVLSFTAIVPAKNEEKVIEYTIRGLSNIDYPEELKEIIIVCRNDDIGTIREVKKTIKALRKQNIKLKIFKDFPINKPHALNVGLKQATKDIIVVFDAEDEPHKDIFNIANTIIKEDRLDVLQCGVQLMNHRSKWFSTLNILEYFFWFKSALHFFANANIVPLGGNSVFFKKKWLNKIDGWDESCLTEDAEIGTRLSAKGAKIRIVYDEKHVTREESPLSVSHFIKQRTRWNQGFLQIFLRGDWAAFGTLRQRFLAGYILIFPFLQALMFLYIPIALTLAIFIKLPVWLVLLSSIPLYLLLLQVITYNIGLFIFTKAYNLKHSPLLQFKIIFTYLPFQMMLGFSAFRAITRIIKRNNAWEKTYHANIHRLPSVALVNNYPIMTIMPLIKKYREIFLIVCILAIATLGHSYNMFHYPSYENNEGIHMSHAWAILHEGKLAPYVYWYDHSPVGWLFIALWTAVTGGFFTFDFSINSGRVFMLVLHVFSVAFLYFIAKRISGSKLGSSIVSLIYALSPLGINFERRVLLENMMIFWLLLSYLLILGKNKRLHHYIFSGILFGIAVLCNGSAIFFLPAFLFVLYVNAHKHHKVFATVKWLSLSFSTISIYFLYALIKGEFFPTGTLLGGADPHVSIIDTFSFQLSRTGGFFLNQSSEFMQNVREWTNGGYFIPVPDPALIIGGIVGMVILLALSFKKRFLLFAVLPGICYLLFLIRGGEVQGFHIIPLIPFFALPIGLSISTLSKLLFNNFFPMVTKPVFVLLLLTPFIVTYSQVTSLYREDQTSVQIQELTWMLNSNPESAPVIMDNYAFVEFHDESSANKFKELPKLADHYWKTDKHFDIRKDVLEDKDTEQAGLTIFKKAYANLVSIVSLKVWKVEGSETTKSSSSLLSGTWDTYKKTFISSAGQVTDPENGKTTSEGQSYALLRAVWMNDKATFDKVLNWSVKNLLLEDKNLFAWWYGNNDKGAATDADQDIVVALLFANKKWGGSIYLTLAQKIIPDIWNYETAEIAGKRYVVAGDWTYQSDREVYTINPSYLTPYAYRMFAEVDNKHNWMSLVDSSYEILDACSSASLGVENSVYLAPDWCNIQRNGEIVVASNMNENSTDYSFDAIRVPWRIALDYQWYKEQRALDYFKKITFFTDLWNNNKRILAAYKHNGRSIYSGESIAQYGTQLAYFTIIDKKTANAIYDSKIVPAYHDDKGEYYWGNKNIYYNQNWVWFGTALYKNLLPNLWEN